MLLFPLSVNGQFFQQVDGQTDGQTDGRTDRHYSTLYYRLGDALLAFRGYVVEEEEKRADK